MSDSPPIRPHPALLKLLRWLRTHAGYPRSRLDSSAEILLCIAALANDEDNSVSCSDFQLQRRITAEHSALRSHTLRRSHAQFKSDNSSKV